jgi:hypothetical protein
MGLYFHHPACLEYDLRAYMPERPDTPERLEAIERVLAEHGWSGCEHRSPACRGSAAGIDPQPQACAEDQGAIAGRWRRDRPGHVRRSAF